MYLASDTSYCLGKLPRDFAQREKNGFIGFAVGVMRVDASYKLSQPETEEDRKKIVNELERRGDEYSVEIAKSICERNDS
jgi:predicted FMN-binding regulatory protein PaiB